MLKEFRHFNVMAAAPSSTPFRETLGKLTVAASVFATILGGWAWAGPHITRRLPLPDVVEGPDTACTIWIVGSSSIQRWTSLPRDLPGWRIHNRGINGALLDQIDGRLQSTAVTAPAPVAIIAYAGENDINAGLTGQEAAREMATLSRHARQTRPHTPFFIIGLKPSPARWHQRPAQLRYNAIVSDFAQQQTGVTFLPAGEPLMQGGRPDPTLFVDGVHMNDRGYALWSRDVRRGLDAALPATVRAACTQRAAP